MNFIFRHLRRFILKLNAEEAMVLLRRRVNVVRQFIPKSIRHKFASIGKLIPNSADYPADDHYGLTRDNVHFVINRSDYVQWRLFYGVRDNALLEAKRYLKSNSIVLDIGSSFGAFSLRLSSFAKESGLSNFGIHAFEPNPLIAERYHYNLSLNPSLEGKVHLHRVALGGENAERSFNFSVLNSGAGRVLQEGVPGQHNIAIQRLDDFVDTLNVSGISFVKLIVEGFEPEVLRGGWKTIEKYRPPLFIEVTPTWWKENGFSVDEVLDKLSRLGYAFMIEHYNEMLPYEPAKYASRFQYNLMATVGKDR